jgi:hypothetical protein
MVEVLGILAIATREIGQGFMSELVRRQSCNLTRLIIPREIREEADWTEGYRRCSEKAGEAVKR